MRSKILFCIGWAFVLMMSLTPGNAFCELKSLDNAELSGVEAKGAPVNNVDPSSERVENNGVAAVPAGNTSPLNLNDPNNSTNVLKPQTIDNDPIPQNQFNTSNQVPSCCSGRSGCPR